jgi:anti-repressor protein
MSDLALSNLSFFEYGARQVRTAMIDGEIAFGLADVLKAMKSTTTTSQAQESIFDGLGEGHVIVSTLLTSGGEQNLLFIDEAALTFLLSRSRTESGKGLNRLIHTQILPTIKKTGRYEIATAANTSPKFTLRDALQAALASEESRIESDRALAAAQQQIEADADYTNFAKAIEVAEDNILVGTLAKTLGIVGPNILMSLLRDRKVLITSKNPVSHNLPYQKYLEAGYFEVRQSVVIIKDKKTLTFTPYVTPKGQIWIAKKYHQWQEEIKVEGQVEYALI